MLATGGGVLAAEEPQQSLSHVATFDVSSGTATAKANSDVYGGTATGFQVTGDGTQVLLAAPQQPALRAYRTSDLLSAKPAGYGTGGSNSAPGALALDTDGTIAVGGALGTDGRLYLYAGSTATEHHYVFPSRTLAPDGLEWAADGMSLYAVTQDPAGAYTLHVLSDPKLTDSRVWLTAPQRAFPTQQFTITGSLTTDGFLPTGAKVQVTRDGTELPDAAVGADGTFSVSDTRPDAGAYTYAVSYAGDATHRPATLSLTVQVAVCSAQVFAVELPGAVVRSAAPNCCSASPASSCRPRASRRSTPYGCCTSRGGTRTSGRASRHRLRRSLP